MVVAIAARSVFAEVYLGQFMNVGSSKVLASEIGLAVMFVVAAYAFESPLLAVVAVAFFYLLNWSSVKGFCVGDS